MIKPNIQSRSYLKNYNVIVGPLLTLVVLGFLQLMTVIDLKIPNPAVVYLFAVVFAAYYGGYFQGFVSAVITLIYAAYFFSIDGSFIYYEYTGLYKLIVLSLVTPGFVVLTASLRQKADEAIRGMQELAYLDPLTGIANRRHFFEISEKYFASAERRKKDGSLVTMMIDIDHFKVVNDKNGHLVGDEVLKQVADVIKNRLRVNDLMARYGGEEFVILLDNVSTEGAEIVAEAIRKAVENTEIYVAKKIINISISIGVSIPAATGAQIEEQLKIADEALYKAKAGGRNRVEIIHM